jgi:DeoR/GlpR family transcriptional regulator of sugar metabolism
LPGRIFAVITRMNDLRNLSQSERMEHVLRLLETRDYVQVAELSQAFAVSEVTVRSDLTELARQGLVARIRGGVRALQHGQSEVGFDLRMRLEVDRKRAIARAAAAMVDEGEAVALDASTTAYYLALELRSKRELVVVTNGLLVATALADAPGITVLVTGGMLRLSAMSVVGDFGADVLRTTRINKGFLGARGLSLSRGLMDLNPDEVRIKQEMADACEQVYGIFDGTKWHRSALLAFVSVEELAGIVTDSSAPTVEVGEWRAAGVNVICVDPGPREPPPLRPRDLRRAVRNDEAAG